MGYLHIIFMIFRDSSKYKIIYLYLHFMMIRDRTACMFNIELLSRDYGIFIGRKKRLGDI